MRRLIGPFFFSLIAVGCTTAEKVNVSPTTTTDMASSTTQSTAPSSVTIDVTVGVDSGKDRVETVAAGSKVTLRLVNPERADEFHLHGFDISTSRIAKGETATISLTADRTGTFEVESHVTEDVIIVVVIK